MAKPITALFERVPWRWVAPVLLIVVCVIRAAGHATALNLAGILVGVIWLVLARKNGFESEPRGDDGLTPAMARGSLFIRTYTGLFRLQQPNESPQSE